jgi:hypothetical protein
LDSELAGRLIGALNGNGHSTSVRPPRVGSSLVVAGAVPFTSSPTT